MTKEERKKWTAKELIELIRQKYSDPQRFSVFEQVANGTGVSCDSWIDAACVSLWPSDGLVRRAFEIKVSRTDFLRELQNPMKNAWAKDSFHEFWFVAPGEVIKEQELPDGVGWMKPRGTGLGTVRAARHNRNPTCDDSLVSAFARACWKEKCRYRDHVRDEFRKTDTDYLRLKRSHDATERFLASRHKHSYDCKDEVSLFNRIEEAVINPAAKEERNQIISVLDRFQDRMLSFFKITAELAHFGILERNELGDLILGGWGGVDKQILLPRLESYGPAIKAMIEGKPVEVKARTP